MNHQQISCFDDVISKKLNQRHSSSDDRAPFAVEGKENGVVIQSQSGKQLAYIDCFNNQGQIGYQLVLVQLSNTGNGELVTRLNIRTFNELNPTLVKAVQWNKATQIQIKFTQSPLNPKYFLWHLTQHENNYKVDRLYLTIFDIKQVLQQNLAMFYKFNLKYQQIVRADWHRYSEHCLAILYEKQELELFNFVNQPQLARISINLRFHRSAQKSFQKLQFVDFTYCQSSKNLQDQFTMYFQTKNGIIYAAFPLICQCTELTQQQINQLRTNSQKKDSYRAIWEVLEQCKFIQGQKGKQRVLYPEDPNNVSKAVQFVPLDSYNRQRQSSSQGDTSIFHRLVVHELQDRRILMQNGYSLVDRSNFLNVYLLPQLFRSEKIVYYPLAYFTCAQKYKQDSFQMTLLNKVPEKDAFYFCDGVACYKFDLENLFNAVRNNDLTHLQNDSMMQYSLIFILNDSEETIKSCLMLKENSIIMIRSSLNGQKFDFISLYSIKVSDNIMQISKRFDTLFNQIETKRKEYRQNLGKNQQKQSSIIDTNVQTDFESKNLQLIMKGIEEYTSAVKNKIDREMSSVRLVHENLQSTIKKFNSQYQQRNKMTLLLQTAQKNGRRIQQLLQNKSRTRSSQQGITGRLNDRLYSIQSILNTVRNRKLDISAQDQKKHHESVDKILNNLNSLKIQLEELKSEQN